jgi:hypothetical protein
MKPGFYWAKINGEWQIARVSIVQGSESVTITGSDSENGIAGIEWGPGPLEFPVTGPSERTQGLIRYMRQKMDEATKHGSALCEAFELSDLTEIVQALEIKNPPRAD